ncbi:hypothetical protein Dimus_021532 [Dionaea muscipula]
MPESPRPPLIHFFHAHRLPQTCVDQGECVNRLSRGPCTSDVALGNCGESQSSTRSPWECRTRFQSRLVNWRLVKNVRLVGLRYADQICPAAKDRKLLLE